MEDTFRLDRDLLTRQKFSYSLQVQGNELILASHPINSTGPSNLKLIISVTTTMIEHLEP